LLFFAVSCKINIMTTTHQTYTIDELMQKIYDENFSHFDFMDNMNGGECDCKLHIAMDLMYEYGGGLC
jgi:AAA15 family ATPase/GTPase